jgi:beta-lactamase superfamily II metal-dependent hydrolase
MAKEIIVFIEKIYSYVNSNNQSVFYLLLDFPVKNSNEDIFYENILLDRNVEKSMLEIKNVTFENEGKPREGLYYVMPEILIINNDWTTQSNDDEQLSNYMALTYDAIDIQLKFDNSVEYADFSQDFSANNSGVVNITNYLSEYIPNNSKIEVSIYDVGQGNWNEILFNEEFLIVYDLGASSSQIFNKTYNRVALPQNRRFTINSILEDDYSLKKVLIISHWDIDHYNGIFEIDDEIIKSFSLCIVPKRLENDTMRRAFKKLTANNSNVYSIEMNPKGTGAGATSRLTPLYSSDLLKIYKGTNCSDRNKRGLLLSLHVNNTDFIFPADHHYNQINTFIIPNCTNDELNIVVPHHGGHANDLGLISSWTNCKHSIISSGAKYGHPFKKVETAFSAKFHSMHRTDKCSCLNCNNPTHVAIPPSGCTHSDYYRTI